MNEFVQTKGVPIETWQQHFKELYDAEETRNVNEYETHVSDGEEVKAKLEKLKTENHLELIIFPMNFYNMEARN